MISNKTIITKKYFKNILFSEGQIKYLEFHIVRYNYLINEIKKIRKTIKKESINIMDIGPSIFTHILEKEFPNDKIYTLGLNLNTNCGHLPKNIVNKERFFKFDLNKAVNKERWPKIPTCDIIICAEVIEHLPTSPIIVLKFIKSFINNKGYLIIQTPNAVSLPKRIKMLFGKNPYEILHERLNNPGHFREYTYAELKHIISTVGLKCIKLEYANYFTYEKTSGKIYNIIKKILPPQLHDGISIILQKI